MFIREFLGTHTLSLGDIVHPLWPTTDPCVSQESAPSKVMQQTCLVRLMMKNIPKPWGKQMYFVPLLAQCENMDTGAPWSSCQWMELTFDMVPGCGLPTFHMSAWLHMGREVILLSGRCRLRGNGFARGGVKEMVSGSRTMSGVSYSSCFCDQCAWWEQLKERRVCFGWPRVPFITAWYRGGEGVTLRSQSQEAKRDCLLR